MSRNYKFYDSTKPHFVSYATVGWVDLFTRRIYFEVLTESLTYCIDNKFLILNAWCIMTNHVHLIIRSETNHLQDIMRDMKKYTSKKLIETIKEHTQESRKIGYCVFSDKQGTPTAITKITNYGSSIINPSNYQPIK